MPGKLIDLAKANKEKDPVQRPVEQAHRRRVLPPGPGRREGQGHGRRRRRLHRLLRHPEGPEDHGPDQEAGQDPLRRQGVRRGGEGLPDALQPEQGPGERPHPRPDALQERQARRSPGPLQGSLRQEADRRARLQHRHHPGQEIARRKPSTTSSWPASATPPRPRTPSAWPRTCSSPPLPTPRSTTSSTRSRPSRRGSTT